MGRRKFCPANKSGIIGPTSRSHRQQPCKSGAENSPTEGQTRLILFYTNPITQTSTLRVRKMKKFTYGNLQTSGRSLGPARLPASVLFATICHITSHQGTSRPILVFKEETVSVCCCTSLDKCSSDMLLFPNTCKCFTLICYVFFMSMDVLL